MTSDESGAALDLRPVSLNGSAPRCEHLDACIPVTPRSSTCAECLSAGENWIGLMVCLTCGWVACSDDSSGRHAVAHYEETDHPVAGALCSGPTWRWCYVHRRAV
ncbi:ubiquitin-hydrolase Zn-finger-containing protein [Actinoallomurus bryophytorum]|uniref:Ubiquitin-hydrolase Zn-finger-containing protein n=1 Tax=Actinoallomurus bryophytorum TaxID=1490222 RepID=A0A543CHR7_9ACTN|nr:UBP-type zinc finger domain-containing protein [Actinoallomurus bryophytorum]TQL96649.1 ubiquitin-hydrolase Zn-finger-containing protein [Actinoallomurus bryophytorum]